MAIPKKPKKAVKTEGKPAAQPLMFNKECEDLWHNYRKRMDPDGIRLSFFNHLLYTRSKEAFLASEYDKYLSLAYVIRDRLVERWTTTQRTYYNKDAKRVYYMSLEFLMGRLIVNNMVNLGILDTVKYCINNMGIDFNKLVELEPDAGLGNGGLGRLAACFLDSMATLELPGYGYSLRYEFGIFNQIIRNGFQVEEPDEWLKHGYPWEIERPEFTTPINFYGKVVMEKDEFNKPKYKWVDTKQVLAFPYDVPIIGYANNTANFLRLWAAKSSSQFDLEIFNHGDYVKAVEDKNYSENISRVLYPNDNIYEGKELRFKQQYFFVAATLNDIIRRFQKSYDNFEKLPEKVAVQLNDTHPSLAIPELMRILVDRHGLDWDQAWDITTKTFAYTNHTVLPEALEHWPVGIFQKVLPRHLQIVYDINTRFLDSVSVRFPDDKAKLSRVSLIAEGGEKQVRMANLSVVGSHKVNGVAKLHTDILKKTIFKDFCDIYPDKVISITNGITPRRWLKLANPGLAKLISDRIGDQWAGDLDQLKQMEKYVDDEETLVKLFKVKKENKQHLAEYIKARNGITVDVHSIFDVQIKRFHEYKRQLLNALHILMLYNRLKANPGLDLVPRTFIFGGKSAPGYFRAKQIIKFINSVADLVNNDSSTNGKLKVVFLANYSVSLAEKIIPASDVSEQISTAGQEASGTGNMKFALNGALTIGTLDGANIEIMEQVGRDNIYICGMTADEVEALTVSKKYDPWDYYNRNPEIKQVIDMIKSGAVANGDTELFSNLYDALMKGVDGGPADRYFHLADIESYAAAQQRIDTDYRDRLRWQKMALINIANMAFFSSDRAIREYAEKVWETKPIKITI